MEAKGLLSAAFIVSHLALTGCLTSSQGFSHPIMTGTPRPPKKSAWNQIGFTTASRHGRSREQATDPIQAVVIATPNYLHFAAAKAALEAGFHVISDKPATSTLEDAIALKEIVEKTGKLFILTHNYTGYPMVRQMRDMILSGEIGELRVLHAEYAQDWLTEPVEHQGAKGAEWRTDPARSGAGGSIGDIGTHAYNLLSFVLGQYPKQLLADLSSFVPGRSLDDNASILLKFDKGAKGILWASQVAVGNENHFTMRVYGSKGGLEWEQEAPNKLWFTRYGEPKQLLTRGGAKATAGNLGSIRIPAGHPEGFLEAFANIYKAAAEAINNSDKISVPYPTVTDGLRGLEFIDACVRSNKAGGIWTDLS